MKRMIVIVAIAVFVVGCQEQQKKKAFDVQDLKLGMQKEQVGQICNGSLELVSSEMIPDSNGHSKTIYRMWPNETKTLIGARCVANTPSAIWAGGKDIKPYLLTFIESKDSSSELTNVSLDTQGFNSQTAEYQQIQQNVQKLSHPNDNYGTQQNNPNYWQEKKAQRDYQFMK